MIPILHDAYLADATTKTNGICRLRDTISCLVTEERNGQYELELEYPIAADFADQLTVDRIIKAKANDQHDAQCFRIYSVNPALSDGVVIVRARHISYDMTGIPVMPFSVFGGDRQQALDNLWFSALADNPFTATATETASTASAFKITEPASLRACLGGVRGSFLDTYGGEFTWDNRSVIWSLSRGQNRGLVVRYGKNLVDYDQETNIADTAAGVLGYYSRDGVVIQGDIRYSDNAGNFATPRIAVIDFSDDFEDEAPTVAQLNARAQKYINDNDVGVPEVSIKIEFEPLSQAGDTPWLDLLERVDLCDEVQVVFELLGVTATAKVVKTVYNTLLDRYDSIELGSVRRTIVDTIADLEGAVSEGAAGVYETSVTPITGAAFVPITGVTETQLNAWTVGNLAYVAVRIELSAALSGWKTIVTGLPKPPTSIRNVAASTSSSFVRPLAYGVNNAGLQITYGGAGTYWFTMCYPIA